MTAVSPIAAATGSPTISRTTSSVKMASVTMVRRGKRRALGARFQRLAAVAAGEDRRRKNRPSPFSVPELLLLRLVDELEEALHVVRAGVLGDLLVGRL